MLCEICLEYRKTEATVETETDTSATTSGDDDDDDDSYDEGAARAAEKQRKAAVLKELQGTKVEELLKGRRRILKTRRPDQEPQTQQKPAAKPTLAHHSPMANRTRGAKGKARGEGN